MYKAAILDDYQGIAKGIIDWSPLADRVTISSYDRALAGQELLDAVSDCQIIVVMRERTSLDRERLRSLPLLKLVVTAGPVNRAIDLDAAKELGIAVCGTRSVTDTTAELTIGLMIAISRGIHVGHQQLTGGSEWKPLLGHDLFGKRLGIIGLGRVGSKVAKIAKALDMNVQAWSPNLTAAGCDGHDVSFSGSKEELLRTSDVVTLHIVLSERTRGLLRASDLALLKPSAYLVNTSRGPLIDEPSLVSALYAEAFAGAAIDVFEQEPLPAHHPLRSAPRVLLTPHIGYVTWRNYQTYFEDIREDIVAWLAGVPIRLLA